MIELFQSLIKFQNYQSQENIMLVDYLKEISLKKVKRKLCLLIIEDLKESAPQYIKDQFQNFRISQITPLKVWRSPIYERNKEEMFDKNRSRTNTQSVMLMRSGSKLKIKYLFAQLIDILEIRKANHSTSKDSSSVSTKEENFLSRLIHSRAVGINKFSDTNLKSN